MSCFGRTRGTGLTALTAALTMLSLSCGTAPEKSERPGGSGKKPSGEGEAAVAPARMPEASGAVHLTEDGFEKAIEKGVALVDFWAEWCPPCRMQGPVIDRLAAEYAGHALVGKVDVDKASDLAGRLGVERIPTLVLFRDGEETRRLVGLNSEEELRAALDEALGEK